MAKGILIKNGCSVGQELNFKVVAYESELLLPATAAENTIAVFTETLISDCAITNTEPEAPEEGMVWIKTSLSSDIGFSVVKNKTVEIYPLSVKQYISGAWVAKSARTYQNGKWNEWVTFIAGSGVDTYNIYGSWTDGGDSFGQFYGDGKLRFYRPINGGTELIQSTKSIDWSDFSTMVITVSSISGLVSHFGPGGTGATYPTAYVALSSVGEYMLDISQVNGSYPLSCYMSYASGCDAIISEIKLMR